MHNFSQTFGIVKVNGPHLPGRFPVQLRITLADSGGSPVLDVARIIPGSPGGLHIATLTGPEAGRQIGPLLRECGIEGEALAFAASGLTEAALRARAFYGGSQ